MANGLSALVRFVRPRPFGPDHALLDQFIAHGDQAAFATLVGRHGPMVLGVCRRVLRDAQLAEDAFQATFLILAMRAGSVTADGSFASWLFGVARRVALAARRKDRRRRGRELRASRESVRDPDSPAGQWDDLLQILDQELEKISDKYRAPLLACYWHGRTQDEAARELGWSLSTLRRRLERGREVLKARLERRGAALGLGLFAGALSPTAGAAVPDSLRSATLQTAIAAQSGRSVAGAVGELAKEGMKMSALTKSVIAATSVALICGVSLAVAGRQPPKPQDKPKPDFAAPQAVKRDQYNDPLPPGAIARMGTVAFRHRGGIRFLEYAADGKLLVSSGSGSARIWDAESGQERVVFGGLFDREDEMVKTTNVSADGKSFIVQGYRSVGRDRGFVDHSYVWDIAAGREIRKLQFQPPDFRSTIGPDLFAPDGSAMAEVMSDGDVWLWDGTGKSTHVLTKVFPNRSFSVIAAAFAPDGKWFVSCDDAHAINVRDVATGKMARSFGGNLPKPRALAISPDGRYVATVAQSEVAGAALKGATEPEKVRIWDLTSGKLVREIEYGDNGGRMFNALRLAYSPDGACVIVVNHGSSSGVDVRRWGTSDGRRTAHWKIAPSEVDSLAIHPSGKILALGTSAGAIRLFDLDSGKETTPNNLHTGLIGSIAFTSDGKQLRTTAADGTARSWDASTGQPLTAWQYDGLPYFALLTSEGATVLDVSQPGKTSDIILRSRDAATGKVRREVRGWWRCIPAPDGKTAWLLTDRGTKLAQWDLASGEIKQSFPITPGYPICAANGGQVIVTQDTEGQITGWHAQTGNQKFTWSATEQKLFRPRSPQVQDRINASSASPDGRFLAAIVDRGPSIGENNETQTLSVCELSTGKIVWQIKSSSIIGSVVTFSPDGKTLAVGGWTIKLYDAATGKLATELDGHRSPVSALAFSADGKRLASGSGDGSAIVWDLGAAR